DVPSLKVYAPALNPTSLQSSIVVSSNRCGDKAYVHAKDVESQVKVDPGHGVICGMYVRVRAIGALNGQHGGNACPYEWHMIAVKRIQRRFNLQPGISRCRLIQAIHDGLGQRSAL